MLDTWCRVVTHEGVTALYYQEPDPENGEDVIHCVVKSIFENIVILYRKDKDPYLQKEFDKIASVESLATAVKLLEQSGAELVKK